MQSEIRRAFRKGVGKLRPASARRHGDRIVRLDLEEITGELRERLGRLEARLAELDGAVDDRLRSAYLR